MIQSTLIRKRTIASSEYRICLSQKSSIQFTYTDVAMSILMSEDFRERAYFEQCQDKIATYAFTQKRYIIQRTMMSIQNRDYSTVPV